MRKDKLARAEAEAEYQANIAAELRAREEEAARREAELEVRRADAAARAEAEAEYQANIAAELRAREEEAERREAELEVRRKDALARAEAQERYEEELEAELQRREEEELRRRPAPSSRLQNAQNGRKASRGRLQVIESARPALQKFDEDETEFASFQPQRQRNRG